MKRSDLEQYLGKFVEIKIFDGDVFKGFLHKTGEEQFKNNPNLYLCKNFYFVTGTSESTVCISCVFRTSHVKSIKEIII